MAALPVINNGLGEEKTCKICNQQPSKYCCPRCNVLYCSLDCYKSANHSQCSSSFYRDCVLEELCSRNSDNDSKRKMQEILTRLNKSDLDAPERMSEGDIQNLVENESSVDGYEKDVEESDDEEVPDLADRLDKIDLDNADQVWERLTNDERLEFESFLNSGDVTSFVPEWSPWWTVKEHKTLIQETETNTKNPKYANKCPVPYKKIKKFEEISIKPPAPCVQYNLINVLGAYAFTARWFNGEHLEACFEAVNCILALSGNLNSNQNFESKDIALESVRQSCLNAEHLECNQETILMMKQDVDLILQGPDDSNRMLYIHYALSDIYELFVKARRDPSNDHRETTNSQENSFSRRFVDHDFLACNSLVPKVKLKLHIKKIEFYMSYVKSYGTWFL